MKMAKASKEEVNRAIELANFLQGTADTRRYESPRWPDTDEIIDLESAEDLARFYNEVKKLCPGLMRVAFGYQVLIDNVCDDGSGVLELSLAKIESLKTKATRQTS